VDGSSVVDAGIHEREWAEISAQVPTACFIGGRWVEAKSGRSFTVEDPARGVPLTQVADGGRDEAVAAVEAASGAFDSWASAPPRLRSEVLARVFQLMMERKDFLARLMVLENGKALRDAEAEVAYAAEFLRWYSEEAVRASGEVMRAPSGANQIVVLRQPVGVSLLVTPWNFPAAMLTRKIGPALAAGCSVVCKPAPETPLSALALAKIFEEAGTPPGVVNVVPTSGSSAFVSAVLSDQRVRKLSFTGSTEVGKLLLAQAAQRVVNCSMELGGNAPFIVFEDADLGEAVAGAMIAKMRNGGQACTAANRFLVHESVAAEFASRLTEKMRLLKMGPGLAPGVDVGPLINESARRKVAELVESAVANGARVLAGGDVPMGAGWYYPPTVLAEVPRNADVMSCEIFGPVAPITTFREDREAIELANSTEYGLVSYCYTADLARGLRVAEALGCGMVGINRGLVSDPAAPFGGTKQSGVGREGGHEGLLEYLETKYVAVSW
jgi:succinate-semialdehyde dehydrogenase/glutarate-semialdehyde dehydrogenase